MNYLKLYSELLAARLDGLLSPNEIEVLIEKPKFLHQGDLAFPCFQLAKKMRKPLFEIARELSSRLQSGVGESLDRFRSSWRLCKCIFK